MTRMTRLYKILKVVSAALFALVFAACEPDFDFNTEFEHGRIPGDGPQAGVRQPNEESRNLLLLYSAGFNNLSSYLSQDIEDLKRGWLPGSSRNDDVLLVYSHKLSRSGSYSAKTPSYLYRIWRDASGQVIADTLKAYCKDTLSVSPTQMNRVLTDVKDMFPARTYGMIFSSHATGYLPAGFYNNPNEYVYGGFAPLALLSSEGGFTDPYAHMVKSVGVQQEPGLVVREMEIADFADAIPFRLDYILFDACLMGGVEVAYELKDKARLVGFSPAEVLVEGLDYSTLASHLLDNEEPDVCSVCEDYFLQYDKKSGADRSATITLVDCDRIEPLAQVCEGLFEKYRDRINSLNYRKVQPYFRYEYHWFYDLYDIVVEALAEQPELASLEAAMNDCIVYKAATPSFMLGYGGFEIENYSGISMYLPAHGNAELNKFYKTLSWNIRTGLVK